MLRNILNDIHENAITLGDGWDCGRVLFHPLGISVFHHFSLLTIHIKSPIYLELVSLLTVFCGKLLDHPEPHFCTLNEDDDSIYLKGLW